MDTVSAVALMQCENDWITLSDIVAGVIADLDLPPSPQMADMLLPLLNQFVGLELLEQNP